MSPAGWACIVCGCTDQHACWDDAHNTTCHWITPNVCSVCWYADEAELADEEARGRIGPAPLPGQDPLRHHRTTVDPIREKNLLEYKREMEADPDAAP